MSDKPVSGTPSRDSNGLRRARSWQVSWFFLSVGEPGPEHRQPMSRETATRAAMAGSRPCGGPMASVKQIQVTFDCAEPCRWTPRSTSPDRAEVLVGYGWTRHR
jgi:hypothetical protein